MFLLLLGFAAVDAAQCFGDQIRPCLARKLAKDAARAGRVGRIMEECRQEGTKAEEQRLNPACALKKLTACGQSMVDIMFAMYDQEVCAAEAGCNCKKNRIAMKKANVNCKFIKKVNSLIKTQLSGICAKSQEDRLGAQMKNVLIGKEIFDVLEDSTKMPHVFKKHNVATEKFCLYENLNMLGKTPQHPIFGKFCDEMLQERAGFAEGYDLDLGAADLIQVTPFDVTDQLGGIAAGHKVIISVYQDLTIKNKKTEKTMTYPIGFFALTLDNDVPANLIHYSPFAKSYCYLDECANEAYDREDGFLQGHPKYGYGKEGYTCESKCNGEEMGMGKVCPKEYQQHTDCAAGEQIKEDL